MRVSVVFRNTPVLVPVGEGRMKISELIEMAITRYKKTDSRVSMCYNLNVHCKQTTST